MANTDLADRATEIDTATGTATTGHVWDGIRELNTPLPRWWLWLFYATIIWSIGYWIVYPAWPLLTSATTGMFDWHSRQAAVVAEGHLPGSILRDRRHGGLFGNGQLLDLAAGLRLDP